MDYNFSQFECDRDLRNLKDSLPDETISPPILYAKPTRAKYFNPRADSYFSSRVYPNGECSIGYVPASRQSAEDSRQDRGEILGRKIVLLPTVHTLENGDEYIDTTDLYEALPPKLGITLELSQPPKKYGLKGITGYGRKMLRNGGHCLDVSVKGYRGRLPQMGTLTLPSLEPERMRLICVHWGDIVKRFFQECKRHYKRQGLHFDYCSCTEIQPKRWEVRREVGLHLHFLYVSVRITKGQWSMDDQWVRDTWRRTIIRFTGAHQVPLQLNFRREPIRQSSAAYLAKYASKGTEFIQEVADECGAECLPSQWWSMSARLKRCIKNNTQTSRSGQAEMLLHICKENMTEYLRYCWVATIPIKVSIDDFASVSVGERVVGYGGLLTQSGCQHFQATDINQRIKSQLNCTLDKSGCN